VFTEYRETHQLLHLSMEFLLPEQFLSYSIKTKFRESLARSSYKEESLGWREVSARRKIDCYFSSRSRLEIGK
jgi:hypothetical protein